MPTLRLVFKADRPVRMPAANEHIRQGVVYHLMQEDPALSDKLHDPTPGAKNVYKLFTFSPFRAEEAVCSEDQVTMKGYIAFEIRAVQQTVISTIAKAVLRHGCIQLGHERPAVHEISLTDTRLHTDRLHIRMRSPLSIHHTVDNGHRYYIKPTDADFSEMIDRNFRNKYQALTQEEFSEGISIVPLSPDPLSHLYEVRFKGIVVKGYGGDYQLTGDPKYLTFLYHAGLGVRNAQGFGMFDPVYALGG